MHVTKLLCSENESLYRILDTINQNAKGIVFVVDARRKFIGTLSDGDIRRAMLAKCSLATIAKDLLNKDSDVFNNIINYFNKAETKKKLKQSSISAPVGVQYNVPFFNWSVTPLRISFRLWPKSKAPYPLQ